MNQVRELYLQYTEYLLTSPRKQIILCLFVEAGGFSWICSIYISETRNLQNKIKKYLIHELFYSGISLKMCILLSQGYYCDSRLGLANASVPRPCPKGHYCRAGTALPNQHPCPLGTFNPRERTDSAADCLPCTAGRYCPSVGLSEPAGEKNRDAFQRFVVISPIMLLQFSSISITNEGDMFMSPTDS